MRREFLIQNNYTLPNNETTGGALLDFTRLQAEFQRRTADTLTNVSLYEFLITLSYTMSR